MQHDVRGHVPCIIGVGRHQQTVQARLTPTVVRVAQSCRACTAVGVFCRERLSTQGQGRSEHRARRRPSLGHPRHSSLFGVGPCGCLFAEVEGGFAAFTAMKPALFDHLLDHARRRCGHRCGHAGAAGPTPISVHAVKVTVRFGRNDVRARSEQADAIGVENGRPLWRAHPPLVGRGDRGGADGNRVEGVCWFKHRATVSWRDEGQRPWVLQGPTVQRLAPGRVFRGVVAPRVSVDDSTLQGGLGQQFVEGRRHPP